jgi:AraC family transcriptional regulator of adaptative response / DNA-3-methyladenine glycosylase II
MKPSLDTDPAARVIRLPYVGPFDWPSTLLFLARRAIEGIEVVEDGVYRRTIRCDDASGTLAVSHDPVGSLLVCSVRIAPALISEVTRRVRRMFDLDADLHTINAHLSPDPALAPLVAARPALRVFGGWDGFEVAARSIFGQQVSVARARQLNGILAARCGSDAGSTGQIGLDRLFPTPQQVADAGLPDMGMPGARVMTLKTMAAAALTDPQLFERGATLDATLARLRTLRGVGDWTAHYIAMRACREPDAFPAGDVGLLRGAADAAGKRPTPKALLARAEAWRPYRAYAAHHLWAADPGFADPPPVNSTARDGVPAGLSTVIVDA